ncbi:malonyl-CoA O-methyltransferase [Pseudobutyrivibrio sp. NOR37]|nr:MULTISPECIES: methyltransferase domain-containing protein [Pseudobutyrivibrio]SFR72340.1 malonyl-CoA O-methyltransferase [Pseudobutyrivibrio sp. NOR37]
MGYIIFGAGAYGHTAVMNLGKENIDFLVDNNKTGVSEDGIDIYLFNDVKKDLISKRVIVCVSSKYQEEICKQLINNGIEFELLNDVLSKNRAEKIKNRTDYISVYKRAITWIEKYSIKGQGIIVSTDSKVSYPEVTGYYIPTLLKWGYRETAISYAKWLLSIQKEDGSWFDAYDSEPYIFDSAQILKGLIAIRDILPDVDIAIIKGCDWILSQMNEEGRLITPSKNAWGKDRTFCDEKIHIYCLSPIKNAGLIFNRNDYIEKVDKIWGYYKQTYYDEIMNFSLLSHFYAYVMEALVDIGEVEMAREAMRNISAYQKESGAVPGLNNVDWVCSTGLFQLALVWFRLGDISRGNKAFEYACKLQNESGGWFGSYISEENANETNSYFPSAEISWAVKYFLDSLYYKNLAEFNDENDAFMQSIDDEDDRYKKLKDIISKSKINTSILDVGCGKGRYLKKYINDLPNYKYHAVDLSPLVMEHIKDPRIECKQGTLTEIPYLDNKFNVTYTCEALEHAIDIESAIREMARVTITNGKIVVIDKNKESLGRLDIGEWEQWFDVDELKNIMCKYCSNVYVDTNINYEGKGSDGLFCIWVGTVK